MSQLKTNAVLAAIAAGEVTPDSQNLVFYKVVWGKKGAEHQQQVLPETIDQYNQEAQENIDDLVDAELAALLTALTLPDELVDKEAVQAKIDSITSA